MNPGGTVALKKHCDSPCRCDSVIQVVINEAADVPALRSSFKGTR
jgi:hypothetical protein